MAALPLLPERQRREAASSMFLSLLEVVRAPSSTRIMEWQESAASGASTKTRPTFNRTDRNAAIEAARSLEGVDSLTYEAIVSKMSLARSNGKRSFSETNRIARARRAASRTQSTSRRATR